MGQLTLANTQKSWGTHVPTDIGLEPVSKVHVSEVGDSRKYNHWLWGNVEHCSGVKDSLEQDKTHFQLRGWLRTTGNTVPELGGGGEYREHVHKPGDSYVQRECCAQAMDRW
jgi:hypothetical protein